MACSRSMVPETLASLVQRNCGQSDLWKQLYIDHHLYGLSYTVSSNRRIHVFLPTKTTVQAPEQHALPTPPGSHLGSPPRLQHQLMLPYTPRHENLCLTRQQLAQQRGPHTYCLTRHDCRATASIPKAHAVMLWQSLNRQTCRQ